MAKPTDLPEFDTNETDVVAPDATRKADGFIVTASVPEKPSYKLFNYLLNQNYKWFKYLDERERAVTHNITSDANYTLTTAQNSFGRFVITDTGVILTATRSIIIDDTERRFLAVNSTLQILTFKTAAGTGVDVYPGTTSDLICDGTDVILASNPTLLAEYIVGTAVTNLTVSGLNLLSHRSYRIEFDIINPTGSTALIYLFANGDTTLTNYYRVKQESATTVAATRANTPEIAEVSSGSSGSGYGRVQIVNGFMAVQTDWQRGSSAASAVTMQKFSVAKTAAVANITQLTFSSSVANAIGVGSRIRIYRGDK